MRDLERLLPELLITNEVWDTACDLARKARAGAVTIPTSERLIAACARFYVAELETADHDFTLIASL